MCVCVVCCVGVCAVTIKWNRETFKDVEIALNDDTVLEVLKAQCFALTNVKPERQKLMCKGKIIKVNEIL